MQKEIIGCWTCDFVNILSSNSNNKSIIWIYRWTRPIQMGWEIAIKPYPNWLLECSDNPDCQYGDGLVPTWTRTGTDRPEPLLTLGTGNKSESWLDQCSDRSCTLRSIGDKLANILEEKRQSKKHLEMQATRLGAPWNTSESLGSQIIAGTPGNCSYYMLLSNVLTDILSVYSHRPMYESVYLCISEST